MELYGQIIEYKIILVGPYKYYERKGVYKDLVDNYLTAFADLAF